MRGRSIRLNLPLLIWLIAGTFFLHFLIMWSAKNLVVTEISDNMVMAGTHIAIKGFEQYREGNAELGLNLLEEAKAYGSAMPYIMLEAIHISDQMGDIDASERSLDTINEIDVRYRDELIMESVYRLDNHELHYYLKANRSIFDENVNSYKAFDYQTNLLPILVEHKTEFSNEAKENLVTCFKRLEQHIAINKYVPLHTLFPSKKACVDLFYQDTMVMKSGLLPTENMALTD